jgi:hypothetical protein
MTPLARIMFVLLRASLNLFPRGNRHAYRDERAGGLRLALEKAAAGGWLRLLQFCAREAGDLHSSPASSGA